MLGMIGVALDTARLYNRTAELQNVANAAALAAAAQLNGTEAGVNAAATAAAATISNATYEYNRQTVSWSDSALKFSSTPPPGAIWEDGGAAAASPAKVFYVRLDTSKLGTGIGTVQTLFLQIFSKVASSVSLTRVVIAGRTSVNVTPLAICALSPDRATSRTNPGTPANVELVEFGFRRGVSYDLMQLNPAGTTGATFVIDPITPAGKLGKATQTTASMVRPFVCAGSMWIPHLDGGITVSSPFPLGSLYMSLNSRFGQYDGSCKPGGAPPDYNVKPYTYTGGAAWITSTMAGQGATSLTSDGKLWTVADPVPAPGSNTAASYGPLWAYARAVPFSAYTPGQQEPAAGYPTFATTAWPTLYKSGIGITGYPAVGSAATPYQTASGTHFSAPTGQGKLLAGRQRRVLNIALLSCPVDSGSPSSATVLGIGRFFMTVPATSTTIYAEFAGALNTASSGGQVELL